MLRVSKRLLTLGGLLLLAACSTPPSQAPQTPAATATTGSTTPALTAREAAPGVIELVPEAAPEPDAAEGQGDAASADQPAAAADTPADTPAETPASAVDPRAQEMYRVALAAMQGGENESAERQLRQLTLDYPRLAGPHVNLGILHYRAGDKAAARAAFDNALTINPDNVTCLNYLGILSREDGRFEEAHSFYLLALTLEPDYALAHYNLGILFDLYLGKPAEALAHYQRYQDLTGDRDETVRKWIVDLRRRTGR